jgi:hypothetical protein
MSVQDLDAEVCLLLACALAPAAADLSAALLGDRARPFSAERLLERAAAHRMLPQVAAQLLPANAPAIAAVSARVESAARANHGRGVFMAGELARLLDTFHAAGIQAVPFKGPAFAALLGDGPGSREMDDLDVLLKPEDVAGAAQALAPLGYSATLPPQALASPWLTRAACELGLSAHRGEVLVELHWRLAPHWYPAPCAVDDVMARLTERNFVGRRALWPAPEELFLIHVSDGMKSCGSGIRWIADVVRILRHHEDLDWARIRLIAARCGGLNSVRVALAVADDLAGVVGRRLAIPALALSLPRPAQMLADEARRMNRLTRAIRSIGSNLQSDAWNSSAMAHFRWALQVADHPTSIAIEIAQYLAGPTVADLAAMSDQGESGCSLRLRALRRRLGRGKATSTPARAGS